MNMYEQARARKREKMQLSLEMRKAGHTWAEIGLRLGLSPNGTKKWAATFNREYPDVGATLRAQKDSEWETGRAKVLEALAVCSTIHEALEFTGIKRTTFDMRLHAIRAAGEYVVVPPGFYRDKDFSDPRSELVYILERRLGAYRKRATQRGMGFDLDREWIVDICKRQDGKCFYTGWEMAITEGARMVSVDRIDSSKGYTKDNCVLACVAANVAKNDMGLAEFAELTLAMADRFKAAIARAQSITVQ